MNDLLLALAAVACLAGVCLVGGCFSDNQARAAPASVTYRVLDMMKTKSGAT